MSCTCPGTKSCEFCVTMAARHPNDCEVCLDFASNGGAGCTGLEASGDCYLHQNFVNDEQPARDEEKSPLSTERDYWRTRAEGAERELSSARAKLTGTSLDILLRGERPRVECVKLVEDMSPTGSLELFMQDDGDIIVEVVDEDGSRASVEFCLSGGHSPWTLVALRELMSAMSRDFRFEEWPAKCEASD